jgi:very-short-patch-repair endonuclease
MANDKNHLFTTAWRAYADQYERPLPEQKIIPGRQYRADFCFPEAMLMIEVEGGTQMTRTNAKGQTMVGGRHNTDADRHKYNLAAMHGWRVMRFSTQQLDKDPESCVKLVLKALGLEAI